MSSAPTQVTSNHPFAPLPYPEDPRDWLSDYLEGRLVRQSFYAKLMDCVVTNGDIPAVLRCLPENRLKDFTEIMSRVAANKREEDFVVIGDTVRWGVQDARRMVQWLAEHPHPQLAPPDNKPDPDPNWTPPESEYEREFRRKVERRRAFYAKIMECVALTRDIPGVLRLLPEDLLSDFIDLIKWVAAKEGEGDWIKVGENVRMRALEARQMRQWLAEHPHPQLAPRGVTQEFAFPHSWDPQGSENERALQQMLERSRGR